MGELVGDTGLGDSCGLASVLGGVREVAGAGSVGAPLLLRFLCVQFVRVASWASCFLGSSAWCLAFLRCVWSVTSAFAIDIHHMCEMNGVLCVAVLAVLTAWCVWGVWVVLGIAWVCGVIFSRVRECRGGGSSACLPQGVVSVLGSVLAFGVIVGVCFGIGGGHVDAGCGVLDVAGLDCGLGEWADGFGVGDGAGADVAATGAVLGSVIGSVLGQVLVVAGGAVGWVGAV